MTTDIGRPPSGRATHERSQSTLSPPAVGVPNAAWYWVHALAAIVSSSLLSCITVPALAFGIPPALARGGDPMTIREWVGWTIAASLVLASSLRAMRLDAERTDA